MSGAAAHAQSALRWDPGWRDSGRGGAARCTHGPWRGPGGRSCPASCWAAEMPRGCPAGSVGPSPAHGRPATLFQEGAPIPDVILLLLQSPLRSRPLVGTRGAPGSWSLRSRARLSCVPASAALRPRTPWACFSSPTLEPNQTVCLRHRPSASGGNRGTVMALGPPGTAEGHRPQCDPQGRRPPISFAPQAGGLRGWRSGFVDVSAARGQDTTPDSGEHNDRRPSSRRARSFITLGVSHVTPAATRIPSPTGAQTLPPLPAPGRPLRQLDSASRTRAGAVSVGSGLGISCTFV